MGKIIHADPAGSISEAEYQAESEHIDSQGNPAKLSRSATLVVAASDASDNSKAGADYVCDGIADNVEIQAAIDALLSGGGKVVLSEGTYGLSDSIIIPSNVWIEFCNVTIESTDTDAYAYALNADGSDNLLFTGKIKKADGKDTCYGFVRFGGDNILWTASVEELTAFTSRGFFGYQVTNITIRNIRMLNQPYGIQIQRFRHLLLEDIQVDYTVDTTPGSVSIITTPLSNDPAYESYDVKLRNFSVDGGGVQDAVTPVGVSASAQPWIRGLSIDGYYARNILHDSLNIININGFTVSNFHSYKAHSFCITGRNGIISSSTAFKSANIGFSVEPCVEHSEGITFIGCKAIDCGQDSALPNNQRAGFMVFGSLGLVSKNVTFIGCVATDEQAGMNSDLSSDAASGQKSVVVADASKFHVDHAVTISDDTPLTEDNWVNSIDSVTNILTMRNNLANAYTTVQNALVEGRTTSQYGISATQYYDGIHIQNCDLRGNTLGSLYMGTTGATTALTTDKLVKSESFDLSGAAADLPTFHAIVPCVLMGYQVLYTEASSGDAGVDIRIGRYQDGVALDDDYFDKSTSEVSKNLGYSKHFTIADLTQKVIALGDTVTVGTAGGKVGIGEVMIILQIAEMAN